MNISISDKTLSHLIDDKLILAKPIEKIWNPKGISLQKRLRSKPFQLKVNNALKPENLKGYIIKVNSLAPTRCIDGRMTLGWEKFNYDQKQFLGAKIAGGTPHAALAHRIVDATSIRDELLFEHDISYVIKRYKEIGIGFGGHADTHQHGWNTGCGAVDNISLILEKLQQPDSQEQIRGLAKLILGKGYEGSHIVNEVIGRILFLDALMPSYMPKEKGKPNGQFLYKKTVVKLLRKEAASHSEPVPQLIGEHAEVALVLNAVPGTTFDTDRFSYDNNGEIQVFDWDLWEMYEEAARLYSYDIHDNPAKQQEAVLKRIRHVTTRTLLGIATAMVLTDGSLKLVTITP